MRDLNSAYFKLNDRNSNVSCHYLISRSGLIYNLLCPSFKAWHAGKSQWKNKINLNDYSIGIELENRGHEYGYDYYTRRQYLSINILIKFLIKNFHIAEHNIIYHSDIAPNRKKDPGEKFYIDNINIKRFKKKPPFNKIKSLNSLLKTYGFSKIYLKKYRSYCIMAVKRSLNYKLINSVVSKKFKSDFYNLLFK